MKKRLSYKFWALALAAALALLCGCSAGQDSQPPVRGDDGSDGLSDNSGGQIVQDSPSDGDGQESSTPGVPDGSEVDGAPSSESDSAGNDQDTPGDSDIQDSQNKPDTPDSTVGGGDAGDTSEPDGSQGSGSPDETVRVSNNDEIEALLVSAMESLQQPLPMDISGAGLSSPEIDVLNIYYAITADRPELKVAYSLSADLEGDTLICAFSYMPYATGTFPEGFDGVEVESIHQLIAVAQDHITGGNPVEIKITNREPEPDQMNSALRQVGGGWLLCSLNSDATAITYSAPYGLTVEDCLSALAETQELADELIPQLITDDMTAMERAQAIYAYITANVEYDQLYYSDPASMPYASQTALGALRDGTAICGGYSNAVKLLFEMAGIECYNVTGSYFSENHMWNIADIGGQWLWFDATSDRGMSPEYGFLRFALTQLDTAKYSWDTTSVDILTGQSVS